MTRARPWDEIRKLRKVDEKLFAAEVARLNEEMTLGQLRRARELTQQELAEALGGTQPSISQLEQQTDMYISTLRRYLEAVGGELDIVARFADREVRITQFARA